MVLKVVTEPVLCRAKDIMGSCGSWITEWALLTVECEGEQKLLLSFFQGWVLFKQEACLKFGTSCYQTLKSLRSNPMCQQ